MKYGLGNVVTPYKDRKIDMKSEVEVYRCLTRKGKIYSIRQNSVVVGHTTCLMLRDVSFIVNKAGQKRCRSTKERNVHAYLRGFIAKRGMFGVTAKGGEETDQKLLPASIGYNPFKNNEFVVNNLTTNPVPVKSAWAVAINSKGVRAAYTMRSN